VTGTSRTSWNARLPSPNTSDIAALSGNNSVNVAYIVPGLIDSVVMRDDIAALMHDSVTDAVNFVTLMHDIAPIASEVASKTAYNAAFLTYIGTMSINKMPMSSNKISLSHYIASM
jgi:hypothetical protein